MLPLQVSHQLVKRNGALALGYTMIMRLLSRQMPLSRRKLEERSLALHPEISRLIRGNPYLLVGVRERLTMDICNGQFQSR
jgi:hypothetical protein